MRNESIKVYIVTLKYLENNVGEPKEEIWLLYEPNHREVTSGDVLKQIIRQALPKFPYIINVYVQVEYYDKIDLIDKFVPDQC